MEKLASAGGGAEALGPAPDARAPSVRPSRSDRTSRSSQPSIPGLLTGFYIGSEGVQAVSGRLRRHGFRAERWGSAHTSGEEVTQSGIHDFQRATGVPLRRVSAYLPAALVTTRYLELPTQDLDEIHSMVPHQLSITLPVDLEEVSWNASVARRHDDGSASVLVEIVRKDQLRAHLRPIRGSDREIWAVVSEGRMLARAAPGILGPGDAPRTLFTWHGAACHLLVEQRGDLVYHRGIPIDREITPDTRGAVSEILLRVLGEIQAARNEYLRNTGSNLPKPVHVAPVPGADASLNEFSAEFAERLAETLGMEVEALALPATSETESRAEPPLALALGQIAAENGGSLLPAEERVELGRRRGRSALVHSGALLASVLILGLAFLWADLHRESRRVQALRSLVAAQQAEVDELERMRREIDAAEAASGAEIELLQVLSELQESLVRGVHLQKISYQRAGRVQILGTSPELTRVDELANALQQNALFESATVLRLQRPGRNVNASYQFEIEAELASRTRARGQP